MYEFFDGAFAPHQELHDAAPNAVGISSNAIYWCPKWWMHRDVIGGLTAAWHAWETTNGQVGRNRWRLAFRVAGTYVSRGRGSGVAVHRSEEG